MPRSASASPWWLTGVETEACGLTAFEAVDNLNTAEGVPDGAPARLVLVPTVLVLNVHETEGLGLGTSHPMCHDLMCQTTSHRLGPFGPAEPPLTGPNTPHCPVVQRTQLLSILPGSLSPVVTMLDQIFPLFRWPIDAIDSLNVSVVDSSLEASDVCSPL